MWVLPLCLLLFQETESLSQQVDQLLAESVDPKGAGAGVLVMRNGEVLHRRGYGLAHIEKKIPVTSKTVFRLASVSKQFTAYAIMMLAERKKLSLEDDVRKYISELPEYDRQRPIRIRDLLHHMSGLPEYFALIDDSGMDEAKVQNSDVAKMFKGTKLRFETGTRFRYTNSNYVLLALVIERISRNSFGTFLKAELFKPLKMNGASVFERSDMIVPGQAYGYRRRRGTWRSYSSPLATSGDGAVMISLDHFVLWERELRSPTLVSRKLVKQAFTPGKLDNGRSVNYGYGWAVSKNGVDHSGSWSGIATFITRNLDTGLTVVVLSNDNDFKPARIAEEITRIYRKK
jgi:CubicO group peptidase (beta-lactamase class C family)